MLLADEPTTALDVTIQSQILSLLDDLKERLGMATLLVTHDMGVVAGRTSRINVMYAGRIVETAPTERLFTSMRHPYTQGLLGSIPRLDQDTREALVSIPGLPPDLTNPPTGCRFAPRCPRATSQCRAARASAEGRRAPAICSPAGTRSTGRVERRPKIADGVPGAQRRDGRLNGRVLEIGDVVREYPVTAGAILKRKVASVKAVSGVTLDLHAGETLGLVGESGCGKTTLGKMVVGIEIPGQGAHPLRRQGDLPAARAGRCAGPGATCR